MRKKEWTPERVNEAIRDLTKKLGHVPRTKECPEYLYKTAVKIYRSWETAVLSATGKKTNYRSWSEEDILNDLKELFIIANAFPTAAEIIKNNKPLYNHTMERFKTLNKAFEKAIGNSVRAEVLQTMQKLSVPECDRATTQEIHAEMEKKKPISIMIIRAALVESKKDGYVNSGKYDQSTWWSLTVKGKQWLLRQYRCWISSYLDTLVVGGM
jgi:hypothetical protein